MRDEDFIANVILVGIAGRILMPGLQIKFNIPFFTASVFADLGN